ncbi:hypothetical protein M0657_000284 [Pyricularia oryzae]|nr:hypothetical protein M9X92_003989 [Pyricularia oryzae]KAI7932535.1 hypothetical protein M0657_000284 [Pyricularia oryzae]
MWMGGASGNTTYGRHAGGLNGGLTRLHHGIVYSLPYGRAQIVPFLAPIFTLAFADSPILGQEYIQYKTSS